MFQPPPLRTRLRDAATRALRRVAVSVRRAAIALGLFALRVAPVPLAAAAVLVFVAQPVPDPMDRDALIAVAGIVGTVLSLGLTVTLLVAQHTAERYARELYGEFRREHAWLSVLGLLGVGIVLIVAASLARPTVATGWAALALTVALGLYAASLLPQMLDSLDASKLVDRVTERTVRQMRAIAKANPRYPDPKLKPIAERSLDIASGMAVQGITSNDIGVVHAGFAGIRRVLVAYIEGSPTRGWDTEIINLAFQHMSEAINLCIKESPVLLLRAALEELTTLGVEVQRTLEEDGPEAVSGRLNSLFFEVVRGTLMNDQSAGAAMATGGIGASAQALIRARSPNMVADHIRRLRAIAVGSMGAERDHVAGQAHVELSKIAVGLASMDDGHDVMPPSLFQETCEAVADSVDTFVKRASEKGGLANDWAWNYVTMPHMGTNLAWVVIAGVQADNRRRDRDRYRSDFAHGANALVHSLVKLGTEGTGGWSTPSDAVESAYMGVLGAMAVEGERRSPDLIPEMWRTVVLPLVDPGKEKMHEVEMLSGLLLTGAYEAMAAGPSAPAMKEALSEALRLTTSIEDHRHRRRRARAWLGPGRAVLGCGDEALAEAIARGIAPDLRELRSMADGSPWRIRESLHNEVFMVGQSMPRPAIPETHTRPEVVAAFEALLDKHQRRRRPRRRPPSRPSE